MTEKVNTSVTIDKDLHQMLKAENKSISAQVNDLLRKYKQNGGQDMGLLELREEMLTSDINELESRTASKVAERAAVRERMGTVQSARQEVLEEAAETLQPHMLNEDNLGVKNWAEKAGMDEQEFIAAIEVEMGDSC